MTDGYDEDHDKFSPASFEYIDPIHEYENPIQSIIKTDIPDFVSNYWKHIVCIIIVLIILFFLYKKYYGNKLNYHYLSL